MKDLKEGRVLLEKKNKGNLWLLTISNQSRRNALSWKMYEDLMRICEESQNDKDLRVMVIRGEGGQAFAAGTDVHSFADFTDSENGIDYERKVSSYFEAFANVKVPTIAVVEGVAAGGGLELVAMCDLVLANSQSRFGVPVATTLGNCTSPLVVKVLIERIGINLTKSMLLFSQFLTPQQLAETGFVYQIGDGDELESMLQNLTAKVCNSAPLSVYAFKQMFLRYSVNPNFEADDLIRLCYGSKDFSQGVKAFLTKQEVKWSGV
jgi:enoyl-CoA hydratase/carnithine racemase